ncbi:hypothetical protein VTN77DRAFT_9193 [Rasamsonia byssochlamydoides]|uniref:uncharacterized protein n=1 Tax=Rasamsonia byssochlamydoides TaxID=89139 RepID=UPI0037427058
MGALLQIASTPNLGFFKKADPRNFAHSSSLAQLHKKRAWLAWLAEKLLSLTEPGQEAFHISPFSRRVAKLLPQLCPGQRNDLRLLHHCCINFPSLGNSHGSCAIETGH